MDLQRFNIITGIVSNIIAIIAGLWAFGKFILPKINEKFPNVTHPSQSKKVQRHNQNNSVSQVAKEKFVKKSYLVMLLSSSYKGFFGGVIGFWLGLIVGGFIGIILRIFRIEVMDVSVASGVIGFMALCFFLGITPDIGDFCEGLPPLIGRFYNPSNLIHRYLMAIFSGISLGMIWGFLFFLISLRIYKPDIIDIYVGFAIFTTIFGGMGLMAGIVYDFLFKS